LFLGLVFFVRLPVVVYSIFPFIQTPHFSPLLYLTRAFACLSSAEEVASCYVRNTIAVYTCEYTEDNNWQINLNGGNRKGGNMVEVMRVLLCFTVLFVVCGLAQNCMATPSKDKLVIRTFEDLYEPSAAIAIEGKGLLIFEDDGPEVVSLHGVVKDDSGFKLKKLYSGTVDVSDIEGATKGAGGTVFAITSHSFDKDDQQNDQREQLIQLKVKDKIDVGFLGNVNMREAIAGELVKLDPAMTDRLHEINIEGLCFAKAADVLMIGLRAPLYKGKAIVLSLKNPYELSSDSFTAQFLAEPLLLDLGGVGIRAMAYSESSDQYFFVSEVETKKKKMRPRLWAWDGGKKYAAERMEFPGLKNLKNIEGLTFFRTEEKDMVLFVCDDGKKKKKKGAHYAIVDLGEIQKKQKK